MSNFSKMNDEVYGCGTIGSGNGIGIRKNAGAEDPVRKIAHHKTAVVAVSFSVCGRRLAVALWRKIFFGVIGGSARFEEFPL